MKQPLETVEDLENDTVFQPKNIPLTETTKFAQWGAEIERSGTDKELLDVHKVRLLQINKHRALSNYPRSWKHQKQIEHIRSMEIDLLMECGLVDDAVGVALLSIGDSKYSQGEEGFYTKEQGRIRYDIKQEEHEIKQKNRGIFGFMKNKEPTQPEPHEINWR